MAKKADPAEDLPTAEPIEEPGAPSNALEPEEIEEPKESPSKALELEEEAEEIPGGALELEEEEPPKPILPSALELEEEPETVPSKRPVPPEFAVTMPMPGAKPAEKQEACVAIKDTDGNETIFALDRAVTVFGRDENSHIVIPDKKASRKHFIIEMAGDYYNVIDAGSTNGTKINGKRADKHRLSEGDIITVGEFNIVYHGPTEEVETNALYSEGETRTPPPLAKKGDTEPSKPPAPALPDDAETCPKCQQPMPENAPCACGYKSLKLQAQEYFVNNVAPSETLLGGLGLFALRRKKVMEKVFAIQDVPWVLTVVCESCGTANRAMNEFRVKCIECEKCKKELKLPFIAPPRIE